MKIQAHELPTHREHLLAGIRMILAKYNDMSADTKRRADRTMENLHAQLNEIDEILCTGAPK